MPMIRRLAAAAILVLAAAQPRSAAAEELVRVGVCARTISAGLGAPFAIASKMGWFAEGGIKVELVPLPGSADCVKYVGTRELRYSMPSIEPLAMLRPEGLKAKVFYTAYQGNVYGIAVPQESPIREFADLKGKTIGVTSMASAGVVIAKAIAAVAGLSPESDIRIVVAGEAAQTAALVRSKQVDALSQFDTNYALVENAGVPLRRLENADIARFPSNGLIALDETLVARRAEAVTLGRGIARGTLYALNNPEAAVRTVYEVFPQTKPTGKDEATALRDDVKVLKARMENWRLERAGVARWGENSAANYAAYLAFLAKWGVIPKPVEAGEVITNDLVDDINKFDQQAVIAQATAAK
jgi:NitT/TauT family transport system substrate-binding protein